MRYTLCLLVARRCIPHIIIVVVPNLNRPYDDVERQCARSSSGAMRVRDATAAPSTG